MHGPAVLCPPLRQTNRSCSNQQNLLAKSCLVLACLRSLKQIAQFKSEKPTRKICPGLANQILNIAKFDTSALDLKIVFTLLVFLIFLAGA